MTFSHWCGAMFLRVLSIVMPALLINTSMGPKSFVTVSTSPRPRQNERYRLCRVSRDSPGGLLDSETLPQSRLSQQDSLGLEQLPLEPSGGKWLAQFPHRARDE